MASASHCIACAAVAPVLGAADIRAEQVTQLVLGGTGRMLEHDGEWRRVVLDTDGYEGWVHRGYLVEVDAAAASAWREQAGAVSLGATLAGGGERRPVPLGARFILQGREARLPSGNRLQLADGRVLPLEDARAEAQSLEPWEWASRYFGGTPYLWGGLTPAGVDCSGLVQVTFAMRGISLPRDARLQAAHGAEVPPDGITAGDLLFFGESGNSISHVAFAAPGETLLHSTLSCGGFVQEPRGPGSRAEVLMQRLVTVRRID